MIPALHHVCGNSPAELLRSVGIAVPTGTEALFLHASSVVMDGGGGLVGWWVVNGAGGLAGW